VVKTASTLDKVDFWVGRVTIVYMTTLLLIFGFVVMLSLSQPAHADAVINWNRNGQEFVSQAKGARVQIQFEKTELLVITERKRRRIQLSLELLRTGDFFVSENGDWVIWILKSSAAISPEDPKNPVIIIFYNEKEQKRFGLKDIGNLPVTKSVSHSRWRQSVTVDFELSKIQFLEIGENAREFEVDWKNGKVDSKSFVKPLTPQEATLKSQKEYADALQIYSKELQALTEWFTEENKKLALKVDKMSDAEVNSETEKLRANYNRRMVKLQARLPKAP
jgi:hypothetical protein